MITFAELLPLLRDAEKLTARNVEYDCPRRCGSRATALSFGAKWSAKCPACGNLGEDDFRGARGSSAMQSNGAENPVVVGENPTPEHAPASSGAQPAQEDGLQAAVPENPTLHANGTVNGVPRPSEYDRRSNLNDWRMALAGAAYRFLRNDPEYADKALPAQSFLEALTRDLLDTVHALKGTGGVLPPIDLDESGIHEECEREARLAIEDWLGTAIWSVPVVLNGNGKVAAARSLIICQDQEQARIANAAYLARPEIIERLGFAQSIGLMIGGKHHGKTTNVRTLALSVMRGLPIWERRTTQGPVIYVASDDEMASTRHELLNMGWNAKADPLTLVGIDPDGRGEPEEVLHEIGELALRQGAILVILDMLFDFVAVKDELGYQDTRSAMAPVMRLADMTKAFVVGSHHTPKYLNDAHNAANAALGSQGVAARFSPIIFTRKWTETLFTVESTMTRDPRGEALKPMKIVKNAAGWIEGAGEFKEWMKWEIYAEGVMAVFEGGQRNAGETVYSVAEKTNLDRSRVQNALFQLTKLGKLKREKQGRAWKYYLPDVSIFEREGGNFESEDDATQKHPKEQVVVHAYTPVHSTQKKIWGDEGQELDENGIPKWK